MHKPLMEAHRTFSNDLAIVSLPSPWMAVQFPSSTNARPSRQCLRATRLGLTVWRADRQDGLSLTIGCSHRAPLPSRRSAERYAKELIGVAAFNQAARIHGSTLRFGRTSRFMKRFTANTAKVTCGVIIGTNLLSGVFGRDQLFNARPRSSDLKTD